MPKAVKMEEYLTTAELSDRIKMAPGTIRNLVWKGELLENVHYVKPTKRKLLFVWSKVELWLYGQRKGGFRTTQAPGKHGSLINI